MHYCRGCQGCILNFTLYFIRDIKEEEGRDFRKTNTNKTINKARSDQRICRSGKDPMRSPVSRWRNTECGGRLRGQWICKMKSEKGDERKERKETKRRSTGERRKSDQRNRFDPQHTTHHKSIRPNRNTTSIPNSNEGNQQSERPGTESRGVNHFSI